MTLVVGVFILYAFDDTNAPRSTMSNREQASRRSRCHECPVGINAKGIRRVRHAPIVGVFIYVIF